MDSYSYIGLLIFGAMVGALGCLAVFLPRFIAPKYPTPEKLSPFECGSEPVGQAWRKVPVKFYVIGMLFLIFDIEVAALFLYALVLKDLGLNGFFAIFLFVFVLFAGLVYAWKEGGLEWE